MDNNDTPCVCWGDRSLPDPYMQKLFHEVLGGNNKILITRKSLVHAAHCPRAPSQEHTSESIPSSNGDGNESVSSIDDTDNVLEKDKEKYGIVLARVEIGSKDAVLIIHVQRLRDKMPYFAQRFNCGRLNFYERYPELDIAGCKLFKRWLYGTSIAEQKRNKCRTTELFSLYAIALTFEHQSLQDEAMDCLAKEIHETRHESRFTPKHVRFAYELTLPVSKLRSFCVGLVAEAMKEDNQFNWDRGQVSKLLIDIPELLDDIDPEAIRQFKEASTTANNTSDDQQQRAEVDDNIQPVNDEVRGYYTRLNRLLSSSSEEYKYYKHARTELDSSPDSGHDSSCKTPDSMSVQYTSPLSESGEERRNNKRVKLSHDGD